MLMNANGSVSGRLSRIVIGMQPRLELRREHEVHEDERQDERGDERLEHARHLARLPVGRRRVAGRQVHAVEDLAHRGRDRAVAEARGGVGQQRDLALAVQAVDARRAGAVAQLHHVGQRHEPQARGRHGHQAQAGLVGAVLALGADVDLVLLAVLLVVGDLVALDEQAQRVGDVGRLHAQVGGAGAVDEHPHLGLADDERGVDVDGAGHLLQLVGELDRHLLERRQVGPAQRVLVALGGEAAARRTARPRSP